MVDTAPPHTEQSTEPGQRFGMFLGVYTPSVLTILGVMMYLRFGWVVGNMGLLFALAAVLLASGITLITGLSAAAIATNMRVGVGGEYYMISRSLGLEMGGAIGIPLFLCRTLSLTLYAYGLAESVAFLWPVEWGLPPISWMAAGIIVLITLIAGKSAAISLKLQLPIIGVVGLSLLALIIGVVSGGFRTPEWSPHFERSAPEGFWYVFAVFFPAVTGFTAGIGMSGDLKDPKRSIPRGTMLAVATGTLTYLGIMFLLGMSAKISGEALSQLNPSDPPVWTNVAFLGPWLVFPGMWGAILSSAFGSALNGPRVLQALAHDGLAPKILAKTSSTGQPTVATWVTGAMALVAVGLGDLNAVGRWVTIFFLTLYVMINLVAALEKIAGDPYYRPTIRIPWMLSLLGCLGAVLVMFLINPVVCILAILFEHVLYLYLRRRAFKSSWGDVRVGLWTAMARFSLMQLRSLTWHPRNWRPQILVFTANPINRLGLVRLATWFNQNRGMVTVCRLMEGDLEKENIRIPEWRDEMDAVLLANGLVGFSKVSVVDDLSSGIISTAQANGFAGLQANTVMFGWPDNPEGMARLLNVMRTLEKIGMNTIIAKIPQSLETHRRSRIDIWWRGRQHNGDLMLLLAHLLTLNSEWRNSRIFLRTMVHRDASYAAMSETLTESIRETRIKAKADVIVEPAGNTFAQTMHQESKNTDVIFLGLKLPEDDEVESYARTLIDLAVGPACYIMVLNTGPYRGELIS
jgi:amino acid transporter